LTSVLKYSKEQIKWRRAKVLELDSQGYTQNEISIKLQIAAGTVNSDLAHLRKQAQENLDRHIHEIIPVQYQRCMAAMKQNLKQTIEIGESSSDPRIKLEAKRIANESIRYLMELCTNSGVISEAIKYVNRKQEQISAIGKPDENIEREPNQIFKR
jgi:hypothetical protein